MKTIFKTHVKIGDKVKVISGSNKGVIGNIASLLKKDSLVTIEGILPRIKYIKSSQTQESKKVELPITIHLSNVMLWDTAINKSSRIGYKMIEGKKVRYFKKSGNVLS
jgi:large subunit ribosomal protein L24